jgi:hypothetical protein
MRNAYRYLVGNPEGKRPVGQPGNRREDNIKMIISKIRWGVDEINRAQDKEQWWALVVMVMRLRVA